MKLPILVEDLDLFLFDIKKDATFHIEDDVEWIDHDISIENLAWVDDMAQQLGLEPWLFVLCLLESFIDEDV